MQSYQVHINDFEGPMDLLLTLIRKNEMDIYDVSISTITTQYLETIRSWQAMDLSVASAFIVMASRLIALKAKRLLPRQEVETAEEEDSEALLIQQLAAYQLYKAASFYLEREFSRYSGAVYRDPMYLPLTAEEKAVSVEAEALAAGYQRLMDRWREDHSFKDVPQTKLVQDPYTTEEQIARIETALTGAPRQSVAFSQIVRDHQTGEVVTSFLAVLELFKRGRITTRQRRRFADILIGNRREPHG